MSSSTQNQPPAAAGKFSVEGRTAIITGAGSGINYTFATLLLSRNCNVIIGDIALRPEAEALVEKHRSGSPRAIFVRTDVRKWDDLNNLFSVAQKEFPRSASAPLSGVTIVCPGAGVFEPHWSNFWHPPGAAASGSESRDNPHGSGEDGVGHYALLDINLTHPIRATQMAIALWMGSEFAGTEKRVVHVSSVAGQIPSFTAPMYVASKHGVSGFIRSLAPLDPLVGIRVNGVAPGLIKTPLWTEHPEKMAMIADGNDEWVEPEEVAVAMVRCCEDESLVGGSVLEVEKGRTRIVDWRMDPGPSSYGSGAINISAAKDSVLGVLKQEGWGRETET